MRSPSVLVGKGVQFSVHYFSLPRCCPVCLSLLSPFSVPPPFLPSHLFCSRRPSACKLERTHQTPEIKLESSCETSLNRVPNVPPACHKHKDPPSVHTRPPSFHHVNPASACPACIFQLPFYLHSPLLETPIQILLISYTVPSEGTVTSPVDRNISMLEHPHRHEQRVKRQNFSFYTLENPLHRGVTR